MRLSVPPFVQLEQPHSESHRRNVEYAKLLEKFRQNPTLTNRNALQSFADEQGFNYFLPVDETTFPEDRQPAPGIQALYGFRFHPLADTLRKWTDIPKTGYNPLKFIYELVTTMFCTYLAILVNYCRPAGDADAIFENFNQETAPVEPINPERLTVIMRLIHFFFRIKPTSPVAFPDLRFYRWTLTTASDYHARHSDDYKRDSANYWDHLRKHDNLEERFDYSERPLSKGYFFNTFLLTCRTIVHNIKYYGFPFKTDLDIDDPDVLQKSRFWFMKYPTMMFVRSQISKIDKLKVRPVYNVPMLFLFLEAMITLALMAQCRKPENCLLWGYETIRGGMQELNRVALDFTVYMMLDWSRFDQLAPYEVVYHFWCTYLPQIIRVDRGWMPTEFYSSAEHKVNFDLKDKNYADTPKYARFRSKLSGLYAPQVIMFSFIMYNLLSFLWFWYVNMVYVTPDGFGFVRLLAGVCSGLFMTQISDSFINAFLIIDAMLSFGFTEDEIRLIRMFIQGDDNILYFLGDFERVFAFYEWLPQYSLDRWHMIISVDKSSITRLRQRIEVLGYKNMNGMPHRDTSKLVATLAYPERYVTGPKWPIIMMSRAIGIAYANAGHSREVHDLCQRAYKHARKLSGLTHDELKSVEIDYGRLGMFEIFSVMIDEYESIVVTNLSVFPDFYDIRNNLRFWHGPHTVYPMWPRHFLDDLSTIQDEDELITLHDVMQSGGFTIRKHF
uniref:RNA dependent RNA polymerase n=1 Tax=Rosellinia necatrix partitivirus 17 TaxID=2699385 RepID=A0A6F8QGU2_9VIRU|nr:RNA dependent RNA polymerase [Rosellinia necatrix partitivirus 17]